MQRTTDGTGCGQCSGRYVTPATSLAVIRPNLAGQWHPTLNGQLTPEDVLPHSGLTVWWLCAEGHATQDKVKDRAKGMVCQECPKSRRRAETSLAARFPELASQWHPTLNAELTPHDVRPYLNQLVWWLCPNGHSTQDTLNARSREGYVRTALERAHANQNGARLRSRTVPEVSAPTKTCWIE